MSGPLQGCKVIELAHIMAGPIAGLMLADMGADVIKIEKTNGDDTRRMVPPAVAGESAAYMMMNRNKRGIVLNLKTEQGKVAFHRLVDESDVLIENYRNGTMERLGLGYDLLKQSNPGLIYCSVSGFGRTGPYADQGGFDLIAQGLSGLMSITGEQPGRPPVKSGAPVTDITAGILAAMGIAAAYAHKLKTGEGQRVDTSLFEAGITQTYWQSAIAMATGVAPTAMGSAHPLNAPYQAFATADGWINVGAANQANWEKLTVLLDRAELAQDPRYLSNDLRMQNRQALVTTLDQLFKKRTTEYWLEKFTEAGVPAGPILSVSEMHQHPQTLARDMVISTDHATAGKVTSLGMPVKFPDSNIASSQAAPTLGQHTREVLLKAGFSPSEIDDMLQAGDAV